MKPWHFRFARGLIYFAALVAAGAVAVSAMWGEPDLGQVLVTARQLYGLWALALLLTSMLLGPLTAVLPWMPFRASMLYGRRSVGVSALMFGILHVAAYFWAIFRRSWRELSTPGVLWVAGLILGVLVFSDMIALGVTSKDAAVKKMGGRKWKRLHRTVYLAAVVALLHASFVGADFGLNRGPDVKSEADFGSLIAFLCLSAVWFVLALLRRRGYQWMPKLGPTGKLSS